MIDPIWIDEKAVLEIHVRLLGLYGGASGVRDVNLLKSALARPLQHFAYADNPDIIDLAATLTVGIVRNHPFVDGNKRTGFLARLYPISGGIARRTLTKCMFGN